MGSEDQAIASQEDILVPTTEETTDDILNKYRSKPSTSNSSNAATRGSELSTSSEVILTSTPFNSNNQRSGGAAADMVDGFVDAADIADDRLVIDPHNVEASFAFHDAKRKLRMMLSEADMSLPPTSIGTNTFSLRSFGFYEKLSVSFESHLQK